MKIDVLVIQEHRRSKFDVDFQRSLPKGWQILLGAPSAPGVGGIGFLLSSQCSPWLLDYKFVTDRFAVASFDIGNRRLHIICVYAPTASDTLSDTKESVDFNDCVSTLISNIPSRDLQIVCGDFNAPLQRDGHRVKNSCGIPTVNSDLLSQFIEANDLIPMNGYLSQKTNQLHTFRGPNERVTRLDWILSKNIDKSHITKINNVMRKNVRLDHTVLIANIDIKWNRFSAKIAPKTDWSLLGNTYVDHDSSITFRNHAKKGRILSMLYVMPRTLYLSRGGNHRISGMTILNLTMPDGRCRVAPISMEFQVGSMPMLLQVWKRCMPQLLQRQPLIS